MEIGQAAGVNPKVEEMGERGRVYTKLECEIEIMLLTTDRNGYFNGTHSGVGTISGV